MSFCSKKSFITFLLRELAHFYINNDSMKNCISFTLLTVRVGLWIQKWLFVYHKIPTKTSFVPTKLFCFSDMILYLALHPSVPKEIFVVNC